MYLSCFRSQHRLQVLNLNLMRGQAFLSLYFIRTIFHYYLSWQRAEDCQESWETAQCHSWVISSFKSNLLRETGILIFQAVASHAQTFLHTLFQFLSSPCITASRKVWHQLLHGQTKSVKQNLLRSLRVLFFWHASDYWGENSLLTLGIKWSFSTLKLALVKA